MGIQKKVLLLVAALAFVLAGCTGKKENTKLVVMLYGMESTPEGKVNIDVLEKFIADNPEIEIDWQIMEGEVYHNKVQAMLAAGDELDIIYGWKGGTRFKKVIDANQHVDQTPFIDTSKFGAAAVTGFGPNGELWAVPESNSAHSVFFSNDALLAELGLEVATTYEEMLQQSEIAKANGKRVMAYAGAEAWCQNTFLYSLLIGRFGGFQHVADLIGKKAKFTDAPTVKTFEFIKQMQLDGVIDQTAILTPYGDALSQFNAGEALYYFDGSWRAAQIEVEYSWNNFPAVPGEVAPNSANGGATAGYSIMRSTTENEAKLEAAKKLLQYLTGEYASRERARVRGAIPTYKMSNVVYREGTEAGPAFLDGLSVMTETVGDVIDGTTNDVYCNGIMAMWVDATTPEELAKEVQATYEKN